MSREWGLIAQPSGPATFLGVMPAWFLCVAPLCGCVSGRWFLCVPEWSEGAGVLHDAHGWLFSSSRALGTFPV